MGDDLHSSRNITIFCPRTGDKTTKWIMELIKKQNDLDTENWRLMSRKNGGGGSLLSLGIDDNSCAKIITSDQKLSFRFGDISVCGLNKAKTIKAGTRRVETPRNLPVSAEKEKPNKLSESSEDLADDDDLNATVIEMGDQTAISSRLPSKGTDSWAFSRKGLMARPEKILKVVDCCLNFENRKTNKLNGLNDSRSTKSTPSTTAASSVETRALILRWIKERERPIKSAAPLRRPPFWF
ncbi:GM22489 [Drosophila sechellia]|uniref:GM22489 n=1 Tax=Drosophila sechellia TaxID=7238 RepID=B4IKT1_DROSE|nr:GM22489 [Drosophila sechellia]